MYISTKPLICVNIDEVKVIWTTLLPSEHQIAEKGKIWMTLLSCASHRRNAVIASNDFEVIFQPNYEKKFSYMKLAKRDNSWARLILDEVLRRSQYNESEKASLVDKINWANPAITKY